MRERERGERERERERERENAREDRVSSEKKRQEIPSIIQIINKVNNTKVY